MSPEPKDEITEILSQLEFLGGEFPRAAVEAAVARREEITPHLLKVLEETTQNAQTLASGEDYMAHLYAMFLLAQFRETRAYPLIVRLASLPAELLESLCGDSITEDLGRILASVSGGDLSGIKALIENKEANEWARAAGLSGLVALVAAGEADRDEIVGYFATLFRGKLERQYSHVWDSLVSESCSLYPAELLEDIENAFRDDLIDPGFIGIENVKKDIAEGKDAMLAQLPNRSGVRLVGDTVQEMEWWACYDDIPPLAGIDPDETNPEEPYVYEPDPDEPGQSILATPATVRYATPKIGRNEPCPCGSGKKYKKCCGS